MRNGKKYWAIARINFCQTTWIATLVTGICVLAGITDMVIDRLGHTGDVTLSIYNYLYIIAILAPILMASVNYTKFMHLGVAKKVWLMGCALNYVLIAAGISLIGLLETALIDPLFSREGQPVYGLITAFGWDANRLTEFFCPFAFLLLGQSVLHTLTFIQTRWYGWLADGLIIVILSVFTPIPALRSVETWFFHQIIFAQPPLRQIAVCSISAILVYLTNRFYLKRRT